MPAGVRFGPVAGLLVRQVALPSSDVCAVGRRRCTSRARTALDLARGESLVEAVVALDVLLARDVVDRRELALALDTPASPRGLRRARQAVALADRRAESPQETRVRASSPWRDWSPSRRTRSATTRVASSPGWTSPPRAPPRRRVRRSLARAGRPAGPGPAPAQPPDRHGLAGPVRDGRRPAGPGRAGGPGRCGARPLTGQAPKSWVHHGPPGPSATPTPSVDSEQFRMFARCPGLSIHPAMTAAASRWP